VTNRPEVKKLLINGELMLLNSNDAVEVKDGIKFRQLRSDYSDADLLQKIYFELSIEQWSANLLLQYENNVKEEFTVTRQNSFDTRVKHFDEFLEPDQVIFRPDGSIGVF